MPVTAGRAAGVPNLVPGPRTAGTLGPVAKLGGPPILEPGDRRVTGWARRKGRDPPEDTRRRSQCERDNLALRLVAYADAVNDPAPIKPADAVDWASVHEAVNAWRGRCLNAFARAEHAVTEALDRLSQDPAHGAEVKLPHLVGQRFEALAAMIGDDGPFAREGAAAFKTLTAFRAHDAVRAPLCHGVGKISVDQANRWTLIIRMTSFKAKRAERTMIVWEEDDARRLGDQIHADAQRLQAKLALLRPAAGSS